MHHISFSLLVPCFNAEKFIELFLENIKTLNKQFDEVIFYDDASTDNTVNILEGKGFKIIKGEINRGPGYARNQLAKAAKGDYIHFHDIDDEFDPQFLILINEKLLINHTDVIIGYVDWIEPITRHPIIQYRYNQQEIVNDALSYFITHPLGIISSLCKRDIFLKIGGFNEDIKCWEDSDLHIRLAASNASFSVIEKVIAFSIRHNSGISKDQQWCWKCRLKFIKIYLQAYSDKVDLEVFRVEVKKIQNAMINIGLYSQLDEIIKLNKKYNFKFNTTKIATLYHFDNIFPGFITTKILKWYLKLSLS